MIARDFPGRRVPTLPRFQPPVLAYNPLSQLQVRVREHTYRASLQVFHSAASGSRFVDGFKESLARSRLITEIMGIKNERF